LLVIIAQTASTNTGRRRLGGGDTIGTPNVVPIDVAELFSLLKSPQRGGSRSSRTRDGMRWTLMRCGRTAREADGEVVWF
jgi:hypothetical protein